MTSSNTPRLADGIGIARFDDWVIVLDIPGDRYTRLIGDTALMLEAIHNGKPIDPDDPAVAALQANAFITWQAPCVTPWRSPSELHAPEASALEGGDPEHRIGLHDLGVVIDCAASRWALRRRSLPHILQDLPLERQQRSDGDVVALARAFDRGRRLAPFTPRCLPDSLAFVRHARRQGHPVNIVFGVKCFPFEAHCWAQNGGIVLTDPLDRMRRFQPLLAV